MTIENNTPATDQKSFTDDYTSKAAHNLAMGFFVSIGFAPLTVLSQAVHKGERLTLAAFLPLARSYLASSAPRHAFNGATVKVTGRNYVKSAEHESKLIESEVKSSEHDIERTGNYSNSAIAKACKTFGFAGLETFGMNTLRNNGILSVEEASAKKQGLTFTWPVRDTLYKKVKYHNLGLAATGARNLLSIVSLVAVSDVQETLSVSKNTAEIGLAASLGLGANLFDRMSKLQVLGANFETFAAPSMSKLLREFGLAGPRGYFVGGLTSIIYMYAAYPIVDGAEYLVTQGPEKLSSALSAVEKFADDLVCNSAQAMKDTGEQIEKQAVILISQARNSFFSAANNAKKVAISAAEILSAPNITNTEQIFDPAIGGFSMSI